MYFPYLRGRQYELLALRELIENDRLSDNIIPIIEPVKITSTLLSTIKTFINNNNKMIIIRNPKVGNFIADSHNSKNKGIFESIQQVLCDSNIYSGIIIDDNSKENVNLLLTRPPKVRPKKSNFGGRYFYVKIQL